MPVSKSSLRTCPKGHKYYKSSDCPTCPICERECKPAASFMQELSAPARRALENAGVRSLKQLSKFTEKKLLALHGMGPASLPKLREQLKAAGLKFQTI